MPGASAFQSSPQVSRKKSPCNRVKRLTKISRLPQQSAIFFLTTQNLSISLLLSGKIIPTDTSVLKHQRLTAYHSQVIEKHSQSPHPEAAGK